LASPQFFCSGASAFDSPRVESVTTRADAVLPCGAAASVIMMLGAAIALRRNSQPTAANCCSLPAFARPLSISNAAMISPVVLPLSRPLSPFVSPVLSV
jgi:hypothetical protein